MLPDVPPQDIVYSLETTSFHAPPRLKVSFPDPVEEEYGGVANVIAETAWLHNLLLELRCPTSKATLVYCDNVSMV